MEQADIDAVVKSARIVARRVLGDRSDAAEEIAQNVLGDVFKRCVEYGGAHAAPKHMVAYVSTASRNAALHYSRQIEYYGEVAGVDMERIESRQASPFVCVDHMDIAVKVSELCMRCSVALHASLTTSEYRLLKRWTCDRASHTAIAKEWNVSNEVVRQRCCRLLLTVRVVIMKELQGCDGSVCDTTMSLCKSNKEYVHALLALMWMYESDGYNGIVASIANVESRCNWAVEMQVSRYSERALDVW